MAVPLRLVDALAAPAAGRARTLLAREALTLVVLALYAAAVARFLPYELLQDGWLTLAAGREIAEHGLPSTDALTIWSSGAEWIDQQWLAQLAFYGLAALGGIKLALLGHLVVLVATMALALTAARRLGATAPTVALVAAFTSFMAPWTLQLRAQTLALPLFVALLWLLASDSRHATRHVYWALPLLALWANVHGTVLVGAGLVVLRGVLRRSPLLALAPAATIFVSPYALELPEYYRTMLLDSNLRTFVVEWKPSTPSAITAIFYVTALATVWLLGRNPRALTRFEACTLGLLLVAALPAIRSIAWFSLAALVLVPRLIDAELRRRESAPPRAALAIGLAASCLLAVAFGAAATRSPEWFGRALDGTAAARAAEGGAVLADERFANWLLWERPELRGRVAFDARFELFDRDEYERLYAYHKRIGRDWLRATEGYDTLVVDVKTYPEKLDELLASGFEPVFRDDTVAVLRRVKNPA